MKKLLSIMLALFLAFSMVACDGTSSSDEPEETEITAVKKDKSTKKKAEKEEKEEPEEEEEAEEAEEAEETEVVAETAVAGVQTFSPEDIKESKIDEAVVVDASDLKVTVNGLKKENYGGYHKIKLLIENNSSEDLTFFTENSSINGYMVGFSLAEDVAAGKKSNAEIIIEPSDLEISNIKEIAEIEFILEAKTSDDYKEYYTSDVIKLTTDATAPAPYAPVGTVLHDGDGVKMVAIGEYQKKYYGPGFITYVHNTSTAPFNVSVNEVSVDGFMLDAICYETITPGKGAFVYIYFDEDDLKENGITELKDIEVSFKVVDSESYKTIVETENAVLNF